MTGFEATAKVIQVLESLKIPYMLVGGHSSMAYGIPRTTKDADIVLSVEPSSLQTLATTLGDAFTLDSQGSFEMVTGTLRHHLRVQATGFEIELFQLSSDPHDLARFERRLPIVLGHLNDITARIPTAEDVIITKTRWYAAAKRGKDFDDIRDVIAVQGDDALDWDYIHHWTAEHGTRALLDEIRASIPPLD